MVLGQGLSLFCQAVYFVLLARLLGKTEYGIYAGAYATVYMLSVYSPLGTPFVFLRYVCPDHSKFALYWGNVLVTILTLGSLFVVLLTWGVPHLAHSYSWKLVLCVAIGDCLFTQFADAASRVFTAFEKLRTTALLTSLVNVLRTLLAGIMLWRFHHATAGQWVVATMAVSFLAAVVAVFLVTKDYGKPQFSGTLLLERAGEGVVFALSSSTAGIYNNVDKAMLGHYGMNAANGVYSMAYRVVDICTIPITSIHTAAAPRFYRKGVDGLKITTSYAVRILKRTAPLGVAVALVMFVVAPLIPYVVGKSFSESTLALRWLCLLPLFRSFHLSSGDALTSAGHLKLRLYIQAFAAVLNFGVNLYLIPHYGWQGAAWSSLATDGSLAVFNWVALASIHGNAQDVIAA
jgi:O-antigen/teichoic acid export membrane protein